MLLDSVLSHFIRIGRLTLFDVAGRRHVFEGGPGPTATVRLHDPALHRKLLASPRLCVPEAYMEGTLTVEEGSLYDFIDLLTANDAALDESLPMQMAAAGKRLCAGFTNTTRCLGRGATRRIITTCRTSSMSCFSIAIGSIPAPISARRMTTSTLRSRTRSATSRRSCCCGREAGARYRLGMGRAGAVPGRRVRCRRHRADPVRGTVQGRESARRRRRAG